MKSAALRWAQEVRIKSGPWRVLQALVRRMHPRTGACFPSVETLAKDTGLAESTVYEALHDLEAHGLVTKVSRRKDGRQTSNDYHLHVGAEPEAIDKRRDTMRRARKKIVQAPNFGARTGSPRLWNSETAQAPKFGPEYYTGEGREDGEGGWFQPGVGLAGDDLTKLPTSNAGEEGFDWNHFDEDDGIASGLADDAAEPREAGHDLRGIRHREGANHSPGWLPEDHGQNTGPKVEDPLADDRAWAEDLPEQEAEALAPWLDDGDAASEAQALEAAREASPSPQADDLLPEAVDEDPAPDRPQQPEAEVMALPPGVAHPWSKADWWAYFDERAGIAEFDGRLSRAEAEALAYEGCVAEWLDQNPVGAAANARELAVTTLAAMGITDPTGWMGHEQQRGRLSPGRPSRDQRARGRPGGDHVMPGRTSGQVRPPAPQGSYGEVEGQPGGRLS